MSHLVVLKEEDILDKMFESAASVFVHPGSFILTVRSMGHNVKVWQKKTCSRFRSAASHRFSTTTERFIVN